MTTPEITAIGATSGASPATSTPAPSSDTQALHDKFNRLMMNEPPPEMRNETATGPSAMADFVRHQDEMHRKMVHDVSSFTQQAKGMDMETLTAKQIELTFQVAQVQVQFTAGAAVAQTGKNGLQTLMKNQ